MKKNLTYLIAITAIMLLSFGVKAQGGLTPLVGSTHNYTITPESTSNTLTWSVIEVGGYSINSQSVVTTTSVANITWTAAGTYHLQFSEDDGTCTTVKEVVVVVGTNTFDVSTTSPIAICNAADGQINYAASDATTSITFTVNMVTGNATFEPEWEIKFTLAPGSATLATIAASAGTLTESAGTYTVTGIPSATGSGTVDITMDVTGSKIVAQSVVLTITSAKELDYNTPDVDTGDWTATQTINAIPNTSSITTD